MSQMDMGYTNVSTRAKPKGKPNVYTAMMGVAAVALLVAIVFVAVKYNALFGSWNVFQEVQPAGSILSPILRLLS